VWYIATTKHEPLVERVDFDCMYMACGRELMKGLLDCYYGIERLGWVARIGTQYWAGPGVYETVCFLGVQNGTMPDYSPCWYCTENCSTVYTFSIFSTCRAPAFSSSTLPSASTSLSPTSTTLSPKAAAISSRVLCLVSLLAALALESRPQHHHCMFSNIGGKLCWKGKGWCR
jgi:hypothetical protein